MAASFWTSLATYCQELAPVAGTLLGAVGDTATAVDRAGRSTQALRSDSDRLEQLLSAEDA
jgi:hypothetical protein